MLQRQGAQSLRSEAYLGVGSKDEGCSATQYTMVPFRVWTFYGDVHEKRYCLYNPLTI